MAIDFEKHSIVLEQLTEAQDAEKDNRDKVREVNAFLEKRDGQWEPEIYSKMEGRLRHTYDKCNPIVNDIAGEIEQAEFSIRVRPAGGDSTKELAKTYDGIIRNIENISNGTDIYSYAGREVVQSGLSGWELVHDFVDGDSFDQDLIIQPIYDFANRVWFVNGGNDRTQKDAPGVFILDDLTPAQYETEFPKGTGQSVSHDRRSDMYTDKKEIVTVGRVLYKKEVERELVQLSDGSVHVVDDNYNKIIDENLARGIEEVGRRKRKKVVIVSRMFDGGDFLTEKEDTVFDALPVIPVFANYKIREGKIIYRGAIDKLLDPQRSYNYLRSREVEDFALAPKPKYWATGKQVGPYLDTIQSMNVNNDPVQLYDVDERVPGPPPYQGGAVINNGMQQLIQNSRDDIQDSASRLNVQGGNVEGNLSGVAIQSLQNKGDNSTIEYFTALKVAICQTAKLLIKSIPKVMDTQREVTILGEDKSEEVMMVNQTVFDQQTQQEVIVNDLTKGKYDVVCDYGPAFKNRQQESVKALQELSSVIPGLADLTADIQLNNIPSPGIELAAERVRGSLLEAGRIPESQLTDDEKQKIAEAQAIAEQQPPEQSPEDKIAEAEIGRVQAETVDIQNKAQLKQEELRIKEQDSLFKAQKAASDRDIQELKLALEAQASQAKMNLEALQAQQDGMKSMFEALNTQADTLNKIREAMGVDAVVGPGNTEAYIKQAEMVTETQDQVSDIVESQ